MNRLRTTDYNPYFVNNDLPSFNQRFQNFSKFSSIRAPYLAIADSLNFLYKKALQINHDLSLSEKYMAAEERWTQKEGNSAEEQILRTIFGENRENNCIHEPRPDEIPQEDVDKAYRLFKETVKDKGSERCKLLNSYMERIVDAYEYSIHKGSETLRWCLYKVYDELKNSELKDVVTYVIPVLLMKHIYNHNEENYREEQKSTIVLQIRKFRCGIDEIERGSDE